MEPVCWGPSPTHRQGWFVSRGPRAAHGRFLTGQESGLLTHPADPGRGPCFWPAPSSSCSGHSPPPTWHISEEQMGRCRQPGKQQMPTAMRGHRYVPAAHVPLNPAELREWGSVRDVFKELPGANQVFLTACSPCKEP